MSDRLEAYGYQWGEYTYDNQDITVLLASILMEPGVKQEDKLLDVMSIMAGLQEFTTHD